MYRNVAYLSRDQIMRVFTWDEDGTRVSYDIPYQPYYYMEPNDGRKGDRVSLYDTPLIKFEFPNEYRRRQAIDRLLEQEKRKDQQDRGSVRLFESISTVQQFLVDSLVVFQEKLIFPFYKHQLLLRSFLKTYTLRTNSHNPSYYLDKVLQSAMRY